MIDLRNIETFFWVATLGGFRAAARKLNATQPAISQRIASLESDLGVKLFERDMRGIKLTAKGKELLSHAEQMLQLRQKMQEVAQAESVMSGHFRLGVSETVVQTWLPNLMEYLHQTYPLLIIEIHVDTTPVLKAQLVSRQIDLGFLLGPMDDPRSENLYLCRYPVNWVVSPKLRMGRQPVSLQAVGKWPIITYSSTTEPHLAIRQLLNQSGVEAPRMYGSSALSVIVRMAQDAIGIGVLATVILDKELASGSLKILKVQAPSLPPLRYTASWMQGPDSHVARTIAHAASDIVKDSGADQY